MASTVSASGSAHSDGGSALPSAQGRGGMEELLPLVLQLTNSEQVRSEVDAWLMVSSVESHLLPIACSEKLCY
jgi:hypothetical protein